MTLKEATFSATSFLILFFYFISFKLLYLKYVNNPAPTNEIIDIIKKCDVCRIALNDDEYPYVVPLNFGLDVQGNQVFEVFAIVLFFDVVLFVVVLLTVLFVVLLTVLFLFSSFFVK